MNLVEFVTKFRELALGHPFVNSFFYNVYRIEEANDIKYASVILTTSTVQVAENTKSFSVNLMYVDRIMSNESNILEVQSNGVEVLSDLVAQFRSSAEEWATVTVGNNVSINVFEKQFADDCAGAILNNLSISVIGDGNCLWWQDKECKCKK